jgi:hypothetical protein
LTVVFPTNLAVCSWLVGVVVIVRFVGVAAMVRPLGVVAVIRSTGVRVVIVRAIMVVSAVYEEGL